MISALMDRHSPVKGQAGILSPRSFFSKAETIEIEIGCGKGLFLTEEALKHPKKFYLGIEYAAAYARLAEERADRKKLANVRILNWAAEDLLPFFASASVKRFHIYFPDPWPKKKHLKRRLWTERFLTELERVLTPDGKVYFATDYLEYFETVTALIGSAQSPFRLEQAGDQRFFEDALQPTSYELKFRTEGRPLRFASFIK